MAQTPDEKTYWQRANDLCVSCFIFGFLRRSQIYILSGDFYEGRKSMDVYHCLLD